MPRDSFAALMGTGEHLLSAIQANSADLAHLEEARLQLAGSMDVAKAVSVRQDAAKAWPSRRRGTWRRPWRTRGS